VDISVNVTQAGTYKISADMQNGVFCLATPVHLPIQVLIPFILNLQAVLLTILLTVFQL